MRIGVDLMGSDHSPEELFTALFQVAKGNSSSEDYFVAYATENIVQMVLNIHRLQDPFALEAASRIDFHIVPEFITMEEDPLAAIRRKKKSSIAVGIQDLKEKKIDAFVTAGNTGALVACSSIILDPLQVGARSALLALLPTQNNPVAIVDVGGNVSCKADHLVQYAHFGAAYQRCTLGLEVPTVGLLNIGVESRKGTPEVREAFEMLRSYSEIAGAKFKFIGNVEGREIFQGKVDVLVTDGFTGNVMIKTSEGLSSFIFEYLGQASESSDEMRLVVSQMQNHFSYEEYPGAIVCGVDGIVVKCHGSATKQGMVHSILGAMQLKKKGLLERIKEEFQDQ